MRYIIINLFLSDNQSNKVSQITQLGVTDGLSVGETIKKIGQKIVWQVSVYRTDFWLLFFGCLNCLVKDMFRLNTKLTIQ